MALGFNVKSLRIRQVVPSYPDPTANALAVARFGDITNQAVYRTIAASYSEDYRVASGEAVHVGTVTVRVGLQGSGNYATKVVLELVIEIDKQPSLHYLTLDISHTDASPPTPASDQISLVEAGDVLKNNQNSLEVVGLRIGTTGPVSDSITVAPTPGATAVVQVWAAPVSGALGEQNCAPEDVLISLENCNCQPICNLDLSELIGDCQIKPPMEPIRGCLEMPSVSPTSMMAISAAGPAGAPGAPGPPGSPGTNGEDGDDGCTPYIIWSYQTVHTYYCDGGPPLDVRIIPFGDCFYWIHLVYYTCEKYHYSNRRCCQEYIWCDDEWQSQPVPPTTSAESPAAELAWIYNYVPGMGHLTADDLPANNYQTPPEYEPCPDIPPPSVSGAYPGQAIVICECSTSEPCEPVGTLWIKLLPTTDPAPDDATWIGYGTNNLGVAWNYYGLCAARQPGPEWANATADCIALVRMEAFQRVAPDPVCCIPTPECPCREGTQWIYVELASASPPIETVIIGVGVDSLGTVYNYYAECATSARDGSWYNWSPECVALHLNHTFTRFQDDLHCCDDYQACPPTTTGPTTTAGPTTTIGPTTTAGPTTTIGPTTTNTPTTTPDPTTSDNTWIWTSENPTTT